MTTGSGPFAVYRRKILHVEAVHVETAEDVDLLSVDTGGRIHHREVEQHKGCVVETREGRYEVAYPFWLAKDVNGDVYPIADDVFERTYEVAV